MKYFLTLSLFLIGVNAMSQQRFDILWYNVPAGWESQSTSSQLTLYKKSTSSVPSQILVYPSVAPGKDADADFNTQWKKYVKAMYRNVADSLTVDIQNDGEWTYYSTYSYATINKSEVVIALTAIRSKNSLLNIVQIIPNESFLADQNSFLGGLEIEEGSATNVSHTKVFRRKRVVMKSKRPKFRPGKGLRDAIN